METKRTRTCEKCSVQVPLEKVRLFPRDKERNWLVCEDCCGKLKDTTPSRITNVPKIGAVKNIARPTSFVSPKAKAKTEPTSNKSYRTHFCSRCKYYFKVDENRAGTFFRIVCPYCGKDDRLESL